MIVVTGATGTIGRELLRILSEQGVEARAISRDPSRGEELPGVEWARGDLADRDRLPDLFAGAERLFLLTGNVEDMVPLQKNAIAAAETAGVGKIVKISALGASDHSKSVIGVWHHNVERVLSESGVDWTLLRPHVFMQNLLDQRESIRDGTLYSPSGEAAIPMIDTRDIAAVAAAILTGDGDRRKRYTLTGPEPISYRDAADILADVLGMPIRYVPETVDQAWTRLRRAGMAPWQIGAQLALAEYQRQGGGTDIVTDAVEEITGRPPRGFREFASDHAPAFREG